MVILRPCLAWAANTGRKSCSPWVHESARKISTNQKNFRTTNLVDVLVQNICQDGVHIPQVKNVLPGRIKLFLIVFLEGQLMPSNVV